MVKRYISLLLILALLPACLAVPVMAEEVNSPAWELMDYSTPNNLGSFLYGFSNGNTINFKMPVAESTVFGADILVRTNSPDLTLTYKYYDRSYPLTCVSLGDGIYRYYGSDFPGGALPNFTLEIGYSGGTYVEFYSVKAFVSPFTSQDTIVNISGHALGLPNQYFTGSYPDSPYTSWTYDSYAQYEGANTEGAFKFDFRFPDWRKYDSVDLQLAFFCQSVYSVVAYIGADVVPVDVNYLGYSNQGAYYFAFISVDLTGYDRSVSDNLTIVVTGKGNFEMTNQVNVFDASGHIYISDISPWYFWFNSLRGWLNTGFSSVTASITTLSNNISSYITTQTTALTSSLSTLGTNIGEFIGDQTTSILNKFTAHQEALINAEKVQQEANRQLMNTISSNVSTWISNQTTAITNSLSTINSSIGTFRTNVGTWFTNQTTAITNSISSWGQSLKDSIDALPKKIAEELKALIVPADGAVESMASKSEALVSDRFGGVFEGAQIVDNWAGQLQSQAATQILTIPVVNMNILGSNFPIGGWEVDLIPDGFEIIFESVKIIIDILATAAFVNGIKNRLERTLER